VLNRRPVPLVLALGLLAVPSSAAAQRTSAPPAPTAPRPAQTAGTVPPTDAAGAFAPRIYPAFGRSRREIAVDDDGRVRLTARAARRFRSEATLSASCATVSADAVLVENDERGTPLFPRARVQLAKRADVCVVSVTVSRRGRRTTTQTTQSVGSVVRSARGLRALRRQQLAQLVVLTHGLLSGDVLDRPQSPAQVVDRLRGTRILKRRIVPQVMAAPDAALAPGALGVWQEGRRAAVATVTPEGERMYFDYDAATHDLRTNILQDLGSGASSITSTTVEGAEAPSER
jgi:hypothetical protein